MTMTCIVLFLYLDRSASKHLPIFIFFPLYMFIPCLNLMQQTDQPVASKDYCNPFLQMHKELVLFILQKQFLIQKFVTGLSAKPIIPLWKLHIFLAWNLKYQRTKEVSIFLHLFAARSWKTFCMLTQMMDFRSTFAKSKLTDPSGKLSVQIQLQEPMGAD